MQKRGLHKKLFKVIFILNLFYKLNSKVLLKHSNTNFFSKRKKEKEKLEFWFNSTYVIMVSLISFLLIYYVWILNINATKGYNVRQLEMKQRELLIEQERLEVKIAELESLSNMLEEDDINWMEKVEEPDYLVIKEWVQYVYNN